MASIKTLERVLPGESEHIDFNVAGRVYTFPKELKAVGAHLTKATEILTFSDNWDDDGANATDADTFFQAADFLQAYSGTIFRRFGAVLVKPYVDITRDGSVSIRWETESGVMFIIFKKWPAEFAYFYAERRSDKTAFESTAVKIGAAPDDSLVQWMRTYLV
ncbi:MAG: hypothetical protein V4543_11910 [Bacteroidota bacterium]